MTSTDALTIEMRCFCRFCRKDWITCLSAMRLAAADAGMLPGQPNGPRAQEDTGSLNPEHLSILLIIAGDGEIAQVNQRNLFCSGPTNILSFPGDHGELGTLFLSADTLERESILYGQDVRVHARRLLAHGMGHITGFDHGPAMDEFCSYLEESCPLPGEERE